VAAPAVPDRHRGAGYGELIRGKAWVQFCLINEPAGLFLIDQHWMKVRRGTSLEGSLLI